jgi:hypothetical protein
MPASPAQNPPHVDVQVNLEVADVVKASCALFARRARYAIGAYCLLLVMVLLLLEAPEHLRTVPLTVLRPLAISLILLPAFLFAWVYWNTRSQFARAGKAARTLRYRFCSDALDVHSDSRGGFLPWFAIHQAIETKSSFLLFLSPHEHYLVPKRCFRAASEISTVRELLQQAIGRKAVLRA